jgi:hypothetical protein
MSEQTEQTNQTNQTKQTEQADQTKQTDQTDQNNKSDFTNIIKQYTKLLKIKMNSDEMVFLKKYHHDEYVQKMSDFVPEFKDNYPSLFQMIISGADLSMLDLFFEKFNNIDNGTETLNEARNDLGTILHNKYVKGKTKY